MVRVKRRYILIEIVVHDHNFSDPLTKLPFNRKLEAVILEAIQKQVHQLYGDHGLACILNKTSTKLFSYLKLRNGILACNKDYYKFILSSLPFIRKLDQIDCQLTVLHVSGTIRGCVKWLKRHHQNEICKLKKSLRDQSDDKLVMMENVVKKIEGDYFTNK